MCALLLKIIRLSNSKHGPKNAHFVINHKKFRKCFGLHSIEQIILHLTSAMPLIIILAVFLKKMVLTSGGWASNFRALGRLQPSVFSKVQAGSGRTKFALDERAGRYLYLWVTKCQVLAIELTRAYTFFKFGLLGGLNIAKFASD